MSKIKAEESCAITWSYSRLSLYEKCPLQYKFRYVDKIKEEESKALRNGIKKHNLCEEYLKGDRARIPKGVCQISDSLKRLKKMEAVPEEWWNLTDTWESSNKKSWLVGKVDAYCFPHDDVMEITDFKTGKPYKKEHKDQLRLYATMGLCIYDVGTVVAKADYIDTGKSVSYIWCIDDLSELKVSWEDRAVSLTEATFYPPRPNYYCNWCSFSRVRGGPCNYG